MKTLSKFKTIILSAAIAVIGISFPFTSQAQEGFKPYFGNVDWQFNAPIGNSFTNRASGWGANIEGGYFITPHIGIGAFMSYSSNHKYIPTKTLVISETSALTTKQQRSLFQLPFGLNLRYRFMPFSNILDPYAGFKLGVEYTQMSSYISTYQLYDRGWGFYMSPEIGTNIWMSEEKTFGFNVSLYYSFATNKGHVLNGHANQLNNMGFRLGVSF